MKRHVALLAAQFLLAVSITFENQVVLVPAALLPVILIDRALLRALLRLRLLLFLGAIIGGVPLLLGEKTAIFLGMPFSPEYFRSGVVMVDRCIVIMLALKLFTSRLSPEELTARARGTRFHRFGETCSLALELLPRLRNTARGTWREFRAAKPRGSFVAHTASWTIELIARVIIAAENQHDDPTAREHDEPLASLPIPRRTAPALLAAGTRADRDDDPRRHHAVVGGRLDPAGAAVHAE